MTLHTTKEKQIPGMMSHVEAFDTISWRFVNNTLEFFYFEFTQWISVLKKKPRCVFSRFYA